MVWDGATSHPLLAEWVAAWFPQGQEWTWASEWATLAARGLSLACNDPFVAALCSAEMQATLGPTGLRHSSLWDPSPDQQYTSDLIRQTRRKINAVTAASWRGFSLDADGVRTRRDLEEALSWTAFVQGDSFAVRVWRNGVSSWRVVDPARVCNPQDKPNGDMVRDGFALDADGRVIGIYVATGNANSGFWQQTGSRFVPMVAQDGTPNVIHRTGFRLPGMFRGVTRLAPMIIMAKQISGVMESYVAGKRLQAMLSIIRKATSPEDFEKSQATGNTLDPYRMTLRGPLNVLTIGEDDEFPKFESIQFNGQDLDPFLKICYRVLCAVNQFPMDVVLCQMGEASLSSARAGLDQFERTANTEQEKQIAEATGPLDQVAISDAVVRGSLDVGGSSWVEAAHGKYLRPPKYSTDRKKDADTIATLMANGVSGATAFATIGLDWEDEQEQRRAEAEFLASQQGAIKSDQAFIDRVKATSDAITRSGVSDLSWPIVLASGAASSAPGAFITALAKPEATGATSEPATDPQSTPQPPGDEDDGEGEDGDGMGTQEDEE